MPYIEWRNPDLAPKPDLNLPVSHQEAAEQLLGAIDWQSEVRGFCKCPGEGGHSKPTGRKDCEVRVDRAPTVICQHKSCEGIRAGIDHELRSLCGKIDKAQGKNIVPFKSTPSILTEQAQANEMASEINKRLDQITAVPLCPTIIAIPTTQQAQFRAHLGLYEPDDCIWHGDTHDSSKEHIRPVEEWLKRESSSGNFISHSTFLPGSVSRSNLNVAKVKYLVVESDDLSRDEQKGLFAWLRNWAGWELRLILDTAGKSLHGWFKYPQNLTKPQIKAILAALKCDTKLLTDSQPSRVAGAKRDGKMQSIIWLGSGTVTNLKTFEEICSGSDILPKWGQSNRPKNQREAEERRPPVILDGLLYARSKLIIGGVAKAGKSYFSMKLSNALARGVGFLRWNAVKPQKVLYIDFELHPWELDERCVRVCDYDVSDNLGTISLREHHFVRDPVSLGKVIHQHGVGCDVIILDCLYKFNSAEDENDNAAMKSIGAWMDGIIKATGAAIILIHHFGKGGGQDRDSIDRFRGASSIVGEMDAILAIGKHEEDEHFIIETTARSFKPTEAFVAHWDFPHWVLADDKDPSKSAKPGKARSISDEQILKLIPEGPENAKKLKDILGDNPPLSERQFKDRIKNINTISYVNFDLEPGQKGQKPKGYYRWK